MNKNLQKKLETLENDLIKKHEEFFTGILKDANELRTIKKEIARLHTKSNQESNDSSNKENNEE